MFRLCSRMMDAADSAMLTCVANAKLLRAADPISSIRNLLLRAPEHMVPLHAVAKQLPDAVMEELGEQHGGLRKFVESSPNEFSLQQVNGVFCVALNVPVALKPLVAGLTKQAPPTRASYLKQYLPLEETVASAAVAGIPSFMVPIEAIAARRQQSTEAVLEELKQHQAYLDIVVLPGGAASSGSGGSAYVRVLPPYKRLVDPTADSMYANEEAHDYDAYRLARHMSTVDYFLVTDLETAAAGTLSKPVPHVLVSYPELFDFDIEHSRAKFVLHNAYKELMHGGPKLALLSTEELEEMQFEGRRGASFRWISLKRKVKKELVRRKFPAGVPIWDLRVFAQLVFDRLPTSEIVDLSDVPSRCLADCNGWPPLSRSFFQQFPHLFRLIEAMVGQLFVARSDCTVEVAKMKQAHEFTEEEIVLSILSAGPTVVDYSRSISITMLSMKLHSEVRKALDRVGIERLAHHFPQFLRMDSPGQHGEVRVFFVDSSKEAPATPKDNVSVP